MIKTWHHIHLSSLLTIESEQELFNGIAELAKDMGFNYCSYSIKMSVPISRPFSASFNNFSNSLLAEGGQGSVDFVEENSNLNQFLNNTHAQINRHEVLVDAPEIWGEARRYGFHYGWKQFSRDASGSVGILSLASEATQLTEHELFENKLKMVWLAQFSHASMSRLIVPKYAPETLINMTFREKEVLRWTAEGKTASEIGQILEVSERTVNFHINNVVSKMGASNKTQAAVKAATLGMLA